MCKTIIDFLYMPLPNWVTNYPDTDLHKEWRKRVKKRQKRGI